MMIICEQTSFEKIVYSKLSVRDWLSTWSDLKATFDRLVGFFYINFFYIVFKYYYLNEFIKKVNNFLFIIKRDVLIIRKKGEKGGFIITSNESAIKQWTMIMIKKLK